MFKKLTVFIVVLLLSVHVYAGSQQTSSTDASVFIDNARSYLNDTGTEFFTDAEMLVWLNAGLIDLVSRSHCLETTEDINLVADTLEYSITDDYILVKAVWYVSTTGTEALLPGKPGGVGLEEDVEEPHYWYDWGGEIGIYPTLSSVTTEKVTVYLVTRPTAIASNEDVPTPAIYDKALTLYIVAQAWAKDRQMGKYAQTMNLYHAELDRYRKDFLSVPQEPAQ